MSADGNGTANGNGKGAPKDQQGGDRPSTGNQRRRQQNRRRRQQKQKPVRLWRPVPQLPDPTPVVPATDPTVVLRSLGDVPLQGQVAVAEHYVAAVVERAAALATALAASADLLANPGG
ncbi:MAG: hypothetical protein JOZ37_07670, partial [Actinobacteria bacterium]|nr:hypothetical protein [Actinomycetota bacterium]MBV9935678.1 hypothetical protein [Actinomycetota bacterium]